MVCWGRREGAEEDGGGGGEEIGLASGTAFHLSLSPSLFLSLPLFLPPLYSALYSAEMTGGKLYCSEFVSIGALPRGEAGGRTHRALSQRRQLPLAAAPSLLPPFPLSSHNPSFSFYPPARRLVLKFKFSVLLFSKVSRGRTPGKKGSTDGEIEREKERRGFLPLTEVLNGAAI